MATPSAAWLFAVLWPPVVIVVTAVCWAVVSQLRITRARRLKAAPRVYAVNGLAAGPRPRQLGSSTPSKRLPGDAQQVQQKPPVLPHDIELWIRSGAELCGVTIDCRSSGEALLCRVRACLGAGLADLVLPSGEDLGLTTSLSMQGLRGGEELVAKTAGQRKPPAERERRRVEITKFRVSEYTSRTSATQDYFTLLVTESATLAEADHQTVKADFEQDHVTLSIRGRGIDYVLRRRAGGKGDPNALPVGFQLCPERCSLLVQPHQRIEIKLRPYPVDWLPKFSRLTIQGLKDSPEFNGLNGTVTGYVEAEGKFQPERYCVKLDGGGPIKKFKRCNLILPGDEVAIPPNQAPSTKATGGVLAWSKARRSSGVEAQRLQLLEELP